MKKRSLKAEDRDGLMEMLTHQYLEEIQEVILECEHHYKSELDIVTLNDKLAEVYRSALTDGLPEATFNDLIKHCLPLFYDQIEFEKISARAA